MFKRTVSIIVWGMGLFMTLALFFAMLFFTALLLPFDKKRKVAHAQCYWWADILTNLNPFWKVRVKGLHNIERRATYVIVSNHQSLADIILLYKTKMQFKWVAKENLFKVPVIGWCLALSRHIPLVRGDYSSVRKVYRDAVMWLRNDVSVLFFPEGTRSRTSEMNEFQNGAFKLAIKEKKPILPIALSGTRNAIPRGSWVFDTKIDCVLEVFAPISTDGFQAGEFERLKEITLNNLLAKTR